MTVDFMPRSGMLATVRTATGQTWSSLAAVFRNTSLRRMQLALAGSMVGDWAYATAVIVWAYGVGGPTVVGVWAAVRLGLTAVSAPIGTTLADRLPRKQVLIATDLLRVVLVAGAALCLFLDTPPWPIFVLATLAAVAGAPFRPAQMAWVPALVDHPEELTASNGASSSIESLAFFVGPAVGALLLTVADVGVVFLLNACTFLVSAALVLAIKERSPQPRSGTAEGRPAPADSPSRPGIVAETAAGFRTIWRDHDLLMVSVMVCAQTVVSGASMVFIVVMAVDILGTGPEGAGYLDSGRGIGALVGGFFAIARAMSHKLAWDLGLGVVLWALPLVLVALWPSPLVAVSAVLLMGFANPLVDVNYTTILQRITPDAVLGRVFGALEGALIGTMALGALVMPFLIAGLGLRWAFAVLGIGVTAVVLPLLPRLRRLDAGLVPPDGLGLLRRIPMFSPLGPATLDSLARQLHRLEVSAGDVVVREGEEADHFFVIESGSVRVTHAGRFLRVESAGEFFGEIGLLRDVPRTATITALDDCVLHTLGRPEFLGAVAGSEAAQIAAEDIVSRRLPV